jgi:hypothetical protein
LALEYYCMRDTNRILLVSCVCEVCCCRSLSAGTLPICRYCTGRRMPDVTTPSGFLSEQTIWFRFQEWTKKWFRMMDGIEVGRYSHHVC